VYTLKDGLDKLKQMFNWMSYNNMETNSSTGLHVSFSIDGIRDDDDYDFLKMMMFFDENYTASIFRRLKNQYAHQMRDVLFRDIQGNDPATLMSSRHIGSVITALKHMGKGLPSNLGQEKYYSFRHRAKGVIEFRNMGSADYHDKFDIIRQRIINMAYVMKLGSDDSLMQREYLTQVYKILTSDKFSSPELTKKPKPPLVIPLMLNSFTDLIRRTPALATSIRNSDMSYQPSSTIKQLLVALDPSTMNRMQVRQLRFILAKNKIDASHVYQLLKTATPDDSQYNRFANIMGWPLVVPGDHDDAQEPLPFAMRGHDPSGTPPPPPDEREQAWSNRRLDAWNQMDLPHGARSQTNGLHQNARTARWGVPRGPRRTS
jgi:hypothetical protein